MCAFRLREKQGACVGTELDTACCGSCSLDSSFQTVRVGAAFLLSKVETEELLDGALST